MTFQPKTLDVMKIKLLIGMSALFCAAFAANAQNVPDHTLSDFKLGDHISGDKVDLSKLDGKVVAIEYWGTR